MALIRVDLNPGAVKVRQFGLLLIAFSLLAGGFWAWRGRAERGWIMVCAGAPLGALAAALPGSAGLWVYKVWMGVSYAIGSVLSPILLGLVYYGLVTPIALVMKLSGRDALRLRRPAADTYWTPLAIPGDKSYFERLF